MRSRLFVLIPAAAALSSLGCGSQPQVTHDNRGIIESLLTAVSAKNPEWLAVNAKLVEERKTEGKMSDAEFQAFKSILDLGREGRWDEASTRVYALREGQRVTNEDLSRVESGVVPSEPSRPAGGKPRVSDVRSRRG